MAVTITSDIVVIGGGVAGVCAALAAARRGVRVSLVTNRPVLGGNSSSEIRVWTRGASGGGNLFSEEMGILGELKLRNLYVNPEFNVIMWDEVLLDAVLAEKGIQLFLNTHITGFVREGRQVASVQGFQMASERAYTFTGTYFIDATGDGSIGAGMGVPFVMGREGGDVYGETNAPSKGDSSTLGSTLFFVSKKTDRPVSFIPPAYIHGMGTIRQFISAGGRLINETLNGSDYWWFELGGSEDTIRDNQNIALELRRVALGVWNYIKNSGEFDAANLTLEWLGSVPGKRESRRFIGAYVLKEQDLTGWRRFEDDLAYGGWFMDFHPAGGVFAAEANCVQIPVFAYPIPFRCLYNPDFPNLLFAGRNISVSHAAFASSRIMNTCAMVGQAAGSAAAYAFSHNCPPPGMSPADIHAIKEILASQDQALPWQVKDKGENLARRAGISASSVLDQTDAGEGSVLSLNEDWFLLITKRAGGSGPEALFQSAEACSIRVLAEKQELPSRLARGPGPEELVLNIAAGINWTSIALPPSMKDYGGFVLLTGGAVPGLSLLTGPLQSTGFLAGLRWSPEYHYPRIRADIAGIYGPHNVQDGILRPYTMPRSWISGAEKEPWLLLEWEQAETFRELAIYFNPDLSREIPSSVQCSLDPHHYFSPRRGMPPELAKDYRVELRREGAWTAVGQVRDNWLRRSCFSFPENSRGDALRIVFESTYGSPRAEVFEIEIY
jgi:hypothetical protein